MMPWTLQKFHRSLIMGEMGLLLLISLLYLSFRLIALPLLLSQLLPLTSHFLPTLYHLHLLQLAPWHILTLKSIHLLPPGLSASGDLETSGLETSMLFQNVTDSLGSPHQ